MVKQNMIKLGAPVHNQSIDQIKQMIQERTESFAETAPTSSSEAAKVILDGVKENKWRILIGDDAKAIDEMVRKDPEDAYNIMFHGERREEQND
jgi:CHASE3 domain sensor protein